MERGYDVTPLSWQNEPQTNAQAFIQSMNMSATDDLEKDNLKNKIVIVEYPSLKEAALTANILQHVSLNLQVVDSRRTWKNTDQQRFGRTKEMCHQPPLFLVLNYTKRDAAEDINGLMPPYTFLRKLLYKLSQLGLTANDKTTRISKDKPPSHV